MSPPMQKLFGRIHRLGVVAIISFALNVLLTVLLTEILNNSPQISFAIALGFIFLLNFFSTRYWVFKDRVNESNGVAQFLKCITVSMSFRFIEWVAFYVLLDKLSFHYIAVLVGVLCISFLTKSLIYDRFVFR